MGKFNMECATPSFVLDLDKKYFYVIFLLETFVKTNFDFNLISAHDTCFSYVFIWTL